MSGTGGSGGGGGSGGSGGGSKGSDGSSGSTSRLKIIGGFGFFGPFGAQHLEASVASHVFEPQVVAAAASIKAPEYMVVSLQISLGFKIVLHLAP